jgi:hypothetical protein
MRYLPIQPLWCPRKRILRRYVKRRELFNATDYCPPRPIIRSQRSYARRRKQDVLLFLVHHRIPTTRTDHKPRRLATLPDVEESYRRLTVVGAV